MEVENKLEEMFAGIDDTSDPLKTDSIEPLETSRNDILEEMEASTSQIQDNVTSTSNELTENKKNLKRGKRKSSRQSSECNSLETTPKKKKSSKKSKSPAKTKSPNKAKNKKLVNGKQAQNTKIEAIKDIYAYDSGSNASSSR